MENYILNHYYFTNTTAEEKVFLPHTFIRIIKRTNIDEKKLKKKNDTALHIYI